MENRTRFDLNSALANWKQEVAAQPGISAEDARELESHLIECFAAELRRGMPEHEAFALALGRLGASERIGAEFGKINPLRSWPHRVALMVFAALVMWAWGSAVQTLWAGTQVFGLLPQALSIGLMAFINVALPLALIISVMQRRAQGLVRAVALLFSSRSRFLVSVTLFVLAVNYAAAWSVWNNPEPEKIFGPGGKEQVTVGGLFWEYCKVLPMWPGPLVALLAWLTPYLQRALSSTQASSTSTHKPTHEFTYWFSVGLLLTSCYSSLANAMVPLTTSAAVWLYPPAMAEVLVTLLRWMPNALFCALAIMAAHDKVGFLTTWAGGAFETRAKAAGAGVLLIVLSHGALALSLARSMQGSSLAAFLLFSTFWPAVAIGLITWLTPSAESQVGA